MEGGLRAALTLSDRGRPAGHRRLLRLPALHPGQDVDAHAAAVLVDEDPDTTRRRLDDLVAANLLTRPAPHRHGFHDLVRAYAVERVRLDEPPSRARQALDRPADHYRGGTAAAMDLLYPLREGPQARGRRARHRHRAADHPPRKPGGGWTRKRPTSRRSPPSRTAPATPPTSPCCCGGTCT
ncbi:MAG: hypothetical protein HOV94_44105 [Saccharothrix sp.]|nr:hypothetical protein [Saccharothrix sp.]